MHKLLLATALAAFLLSSCTAKVQQQEWARFTNFEYTGNDTYYNDNPLTAPDQAYNPILPGWYSDPSMCADGKGNYYIVTSTFGHYPGVPLFHSSDLMNWNQMGSILTREEQLPLVGQNMGKEGIYAAAMFYNKHNDTYYMITTNLGRMTHYWKPGNFIVKAKDPEGEWSDPIWLENMGGIDPSLFFDDDGRAYVLYCRMHNRDYPGHNSIIMQEYSVPGDSVITSTASVIADRGAFPEEKPMCLEGPHLYKVNGKYYLLCAEGGTELQHSEVVFRSDSLWGEYKPWENNPILTQRDLGERKDGVYCTGHADIFQDQQGEWWAVFLGSRQLSGMMENLGRETYLLPVEWTVDGWPVILEKGKEVQRVITIPSAVRGTTPTFGNFSVADDFSGKTLAPYWQSVRWRDSSKVSLTVSPGALSLKYDSASPSDLNSSPAFIGRRLQHHVFSASVTVEPVYNNGCRAGLLLLKSEDRQYFLAVEKEGEAAEVKLIKVGDNGSETVIASAPVKASKKINLRISSKTGESFDFEYSAGGRKWQQLIEGIEAGYLATQVAATASSFTGTLVGPYAVMTNE